jgi:hypothetical protein
MEMGVDSLTLRSLFFGDTAFIGREGGVRVVLVAKSKCASVTYSSPVDQRIGLTGHLVRISGRQMLTRNIEALCRLLDNSA